MANYHVPVLVNETVKYLINNIDGVYVDCTAGTGGHIEAISQHLSKNAVIIAIDGDEQSLDICKNRFKNMNNIIYANDNFKNIKKIIFTNGYTKVDGILVDLGLSNFLLNSSGRGFTYKKDEPLDMRFITSQKYTARSFLNNAPFEELKSELKKYSEDRYAAKIAREIIKERATQPIETTGQLVSIIKRVAPEPFLTKTLSRIFQAIRIHVNKEMENLQALLEQSISILNPGGRIVIISYHSIEDRIVKNFFKTESTDCICPDNFPICTCNHKKTIKILTRKHITPGKNEIEKNPNARSAKLRAAERLN